MASGFNAEGGSKNFRFSTWPSHSGLHEYLRLVRPPGRPRDGYFLRAESFYNVATAAEHKYGVVDAYGGRSLHEQSHGESFMALVLHRLKVTLATVIPLGFSLWAAARPASRTALWLVLAMWATLLLNAVWHVAAALVLFGGYAPGVVTALALNLPLSVLVLRRAVVEQWLNRRARLALVPAAVAFHLPGALGVMLLGRALGGSG